MEDYKTIFEFNLKDTFALKDKLKLYFEFYDFKLKNDENNNFDFVKKGSMLDGWKINPLNWESKITIKISENDKVNTSYTAMSNGSISPIAMTPLYENFLSNLERFINYKEDFKDKNEVQIAKARKKVLKYYALVVLGIVLGSFLGAMLSHITEIKLFGYLGIILGALGTMKLINRYTLKNKVQKAL
jgi:hypothetical protein